MNRSVQKMFIASTFAIVIAGTSVVSAQGQVLLSASFFGGAGDQIATGVTVGSDGVYLSGMSGYYQASIAAKFALSPGASPIWATLWPSSSGKDTGEGFWGVTSAANGVYYAGSSLSQTTDNIGGKEGKGVVVNFPTGGPTGADIGGATWVAKPMFFPAYQGGENLIGITAVTEGGHNYIYASGYGQTNGANDTPVLTKYDEFGNQLWQVPIGDTAAGRGGDASSVAALNGNIYAVGAQTSLSAASSQAMLWKYDSSGNAIWSVSYGGVNGARAQSVITQGNTIYVTGILFNGPNGGEDLFVRRYDESGNLIWSATWGGSADDVGNGIAVSGNHVYVVGTTASSGAGGTDAVLLDLNATTGVIENTLYYGGSLDDGASAVAVSGSDLYVAGFSKSFANSTGNLAGQSDAMLLHYSLGTQATPEPGATALLGGIAIAGGIFVRRRLRRA